MAAVPWIQTRSGVAFDLLAPAADMVKREDIAHSLSRLARYSGHTIETWTVAEHSLLVADLLASWGCPAAVVREGLLHDAPETYYGYTVSPVAAAMREILVGALDGVLDGMQVTGARGDAHMLDPLRRLRECVDRVVRAALSLPETETPIVKRADLVALAIERRDLMVPCERDWSLPEYAPRDWPRLVPAAGEAFSPGVKIGAAFLARWDALDAEVLR